MTCRMIPAALMLVAFGYSCSVAATASETSVSQTLDPMQGETLMLGGVSGVAYFTIEPDGYRVIATLSTTDGKPVRFIATLQPEQSVTVSVPRGVHEPALEAVFVRHGNQLIVLQSSPKGRS